MGQNAQADPAFHAGLAVVTTAAQAEGPLEHTDPTLDPGPEPGGTAESWALLPSPSLKVSAKKPLKIHSWRLAVPTTYQQVETILNNKTRADRFSSKVGSLEVSMVEASFPMTTKLFATGNSPLGRGVKGAIPLHTIFESPNLLVQPGNPLRTRLALTIGSSYLSGK